MREWRLVRNAQKLQRHSSELVSGATDSIRRKAARARDMLPSRQSDANDHAINDDANNDIGDEFDEDFVPEEVENRRRVTKARSRRRESAMNASIIRDADDFINEVEIENNLRWKEYAVLVDDVSRFWFPFVYVIAVSIVLAQAK